MKIKVKGSHELLRDFCRAVRIGISGEIKLLPQEETLDCFYDNLIDMFHYNASFLASKYVIPLNHIEIWSEDEADDELVKWVKTEPMVLAEMVYIHLAEQILKFELHKIESQLAA